MLSAVIQYTTIKPREEEKLVMGGLLQANGETLLGLSALSLSKLGFPTAEEADQPSQILVLGSCSSSLIRRFKIGF